MRRFCAWCAFQTSAAGMPFARSQSSAPSPADRHCSDFAPNLFNNSRWFVPQDDRLVIEAQVAPQDVDKIAGGLTAMVRLSAFDLRTTPELNGTVVSASADRLMDEMSGLPYYLIDVRIPESELARLDGLTLMDTVSLTPRPTSRSWAVRLSHGQYSM